LAADLLFHPSDVAPPKKQPNPTTTSKASLGAVLHFPQQHSIIFFFPLTETGLIEQDLYQESIAFRQSNSKLDTPLSPVISRVHANMDPFPACSLQIPVVANDPRQNGSS
jgi:hypothetical protein